MDREKQPERICRNCSKATKEPGHREHYKVGLRNCEHLPTYKFVTGGHTCPRWSSKA